MGQALFFQKYEGYESDYLVYDINKNPQMLDQGMMHRIQGRNFSSELAQILVGPFVDHQRSYMKVYDSNGREAEADSSSRKIAAHYLQSAGYVSGTPEKVRRQPSKVYCWC